MENQCSHGSRLGHWNPVIINALRLSVRFQVFQRFSFGASGWFFEAPTLYYSFFHASYAMHGRYLGLEMGMVKGSLLHLVISRMKVVMRVKESG